MKKCLIAVAVVAAVSVTTGCTVANYAEMAVDRYCDLPAPVRVANREAVAIAVAPNRIKIDCAE